MNRFILFSFCLFLFFFLSGQKVSAFTEFPVESSTEGVFSSDLSFDGTHFLSVMYSDSTNKAVYGQLFSADGSLSGSRFTIGSGANPLVAFDGTNYLVVWHEKYYASWGNSESNEETTGRLFGQFVNTSGELTGSAFTIATGVSSRFFREGDLAFHDSCYMVAYCTGNDDQDISYILYAQRISTSGALIGSATEVSTISPREVTLGYDGTNYLFAWVRDEDEQAEDGTDPLSDVYGQFVSRTGTLIGSNFMIDDGIYESSNSMSVCFDGTRYWLAFHEGSSTDNYNLYGRFISASGTVSDRIIIADSTLSGHSPMLAFDGTNYLATWIVMSNTVAIRGRYFNTSGTALDTAFTIAGPSGTKFPLGGVYSYFQDYGYLIGYTRIAYANEAFYDGDIYFGFIPSSTSALNMPVKGSIVLSPNPAANAFQATGFNETAVLTMTDLSGRSMLKRNVSAGESVSVTVLPAGMYLVNILSEEGSETRKLLVEK